MTLRDLEVMVAFDYMCIPDIFWENVGKDRDKVCGAAMKAKSKGDLDRIIQQYI